jgi:hypothetical protein
MEDYKLVVPLHAGAAEAAGFVAHLPERDVRRLDAPVGPQDVDTVIDSRIKRHGIFYESAAAKSTPKKDDLGRRICSVMPN